MLASALRNRRVQPNSACLDEKRPVARFSERVWNIDWADCLPRTITSDEVVVEYSTVDEALPFIAANFAMVLEEEPETYAFLEQRTSAVKTRYYQEFGDVFRFSHQDKSVGFLICTPIDWSTYYLRFIIVLREYHGKKLFQGFLPILLDILKVNGVERVEAHTSPSNLAIVHILNKFKFNVVGTVLTDRWGALVHFTKFLNTDGEGIFLRQYCTGVKYQLRGRNRMDSPERRPL